MILKKNNQVKFNIFSFISTFARSLIDIFISLYLFKNGFSLQLIMLFYFLENFLSIFISYLFVKIGEKYNYLVVMYFGITAFIILQIVLNNVTNSTLYILLISILYAIYRRGYWVSRRFYIANVIPSKNSTEPYSIVAIFAEIASILSGYVGAILLDNLNMTIMTIISCGLLIISVIPLINIKYKKEQKKIELRKYIKKYDKRNYIAFAVYELNNLISFILPLYVAVYIKNTYHMTGVMNAINSIAIIVFMFIYGKLIKKKNYFVLSSVLFIIICAVKTFLASYLIIVVYFIEGLVKKMQNQSVNKIYFENRNDMDLTHYTLIYELNQTFIRSIVALPLIFVNDLRFMIMFVLTVMTIGLAIYSYQRKSAILK